MKYTVLKQLGFDGIVKDEKGAIHQIHQTWCDNCGRLTSEVHVGCCGYASNGWTAKEPCACKGSEG